MYIHRVYWNMKDTNIILRIDSEKKASWQDKAEKEGVSLSQYIINRVEKGVYTKREKKDVYTEKEKEGVYTEELPSVEDFKIREEYSVIKPKKVTLEDLQGEVEEAIEVGEKENWERVRGLLSKAGYEWDARQKAILKDGRVVYRPKNR
jgi:hypothetical protein